MLIQLLTDYLVTFGSILIGFAVALIIFVICVGMR